MTPQQLQLLEGILSYDRSLIEHGKTPLSETALALYVQLVAGTPAPTLGVHRSYARLGEEIGSRSANGKPMKAKAIAKAVHELDTHELFERRRDNPLTHASDGPGSIHEFRLVELTPIVKPASRKAIAAILNAAASARMVGPVNFAVGMRLLYRADATLSLSGLSQAELAEAAGVVRETAAKALDVLQANKLFVASWGKTGERRNRDTGRKQAEFSVQLFAGERVEAAPPAVETDDVIEIAPVEKRPATKPRRAAEIEAELEQLLSSSRFRPHLEKALAIYAEKHGERKNGVFKPMKLTPYTKVVFIRELVAREAAFKDQPQKFGKALASTNKGMAGKGPGVFQKRYLPYLDVVLADEASSGKPATTPAKQLEKEIRSILLRCSELNSGTEDGRKDPQEAQRLFKEQVGPRRREIADRLFAGDFKYASASLLEAFKQGVDAFVGIETRRSYPVKYANWDWPADVPTTQQRREMAA